MFLRNVNIILSHPEKNARFFKPYYMEEEMYWIAKFKVQYQEVLTLACRLKQINK